MTGRRGRRPSHRRPTPHAPATGVANVTIESIAAGGDGVGRVDGLACFIPRTAPGDVVHASLVVHARHARGRVLQLLTASPSRVAPLCRHYDADQCGGCQLQHLALRSQCDAKATIVREALRRIGGRFVDLPTVESSADAWHYRRKITLTVIHRGQGWIGGLHPLDDPDAVFPLEECPICDAGLIAAWESVKSASQWLPAAPSLRVMLRLLDGDTDAHADAGTDAAGTRRFAAVITGGTDWSAASRFADAVPGLEALWWQAATGTRHTIVPPAEADRGAASFVQVNRAMAARLLDYVEAQVRTFSPHTVIDAYAGTGLLASRLGRSGVQVTAIEWDRDAVTAMRHELPGDAVVIAAAVEAALPAALPADVVVLNPPRTGVDETVTRSLASAATLGVRAIVYVSCDPATLGRDLHRLTGWCIASLRCFDMFPQTAHVETVCVLVPEAA
jgi:23S rRNA (uracil1939-C5)-methyltransferase